MQPQTTIPDETLDCATAVLMHKDYGLGVVLDALDSPLYVTDAEGVVVYANAACADFAGRDPRPGEDRWCVSWKLYTPDGQYLPHDDCPMAIAIRGRAPVRGVSAIAERPDGRRLNFTPLPTPLFGRRGELIGAVNMFTDCRETACA